MKNADPVFVRRVVVNATFVLLLGLCILLIRDNAKLHRQVEDIQVTCQMYENELMHLYTLNNK